MAEKVEDNENYIKTGKVGKSEDQEVLDEYSIQAEERAEFRDKSTSRKLVAFMQTPA